MATMALVMITYLSLLYSLHTKVKTSRQGTCSKTVMVDNCVDKNIFFPSFTCVPCWLKAIEKQYQYFTGISSYLGYRMIWVPRLTGKTRITGKTTEIPERPKNNRGYFLY